jgi:transcriptional regulator
MYIPSHFEQPQTEAMHRLIRERPLATLVTPSDEGLTADHLPLHLSSDPGDLGTLRGHIARNNPLWRGTAHEITALAVFTGPDSYISPSWYPTKREHGKAVPTWNYLAVHASGTLRFIDDAAVKFTSTS